MTTIDTAVTIVLCIIALGLWVLVGVIWTREPVQVTIERARLQSSRDDDDSESDEDKPSPQDPLAARKEWARRHGLAVEL